MKPFGLSLSKPAALAALLTLTAPAAARDSLGVFERWGAFRDAAPARCYAIAQPVRPVARNAAWQPFASVAFWPTLRQRNQLHFRLSERRAVDARVLLSIGGKRFELLAGGADAWAPHPRIDAAIIAEMRSAQSMTVTSRSLSGRAFSDTYRLRGAATAIDAAALGCARAH
jgi:hypothetical protein